MTKKELRDEIYNEFITKYYQSNLCQIADNANYNLCQNGELHLEEDAFEMIEELADAAIEVMVLSNVLKAKKQECKIQ